MSLLVMVCEVDLTYHNNTSLLKINSCLEAFEDDVVVVMQVMWLLLLLPSSWGIRTIFLLYVLPLNTTETRALQLKIREQEYAKEIKLLSELSKKRQQQQQQEEEEQMASAPKLLNIPTVESVAPEASVAVPNEDDSATPEPASSAIKSKQADDGQPEETAIPSLPEDVEEDHWWEPPKKWASELNPGSDTAPASARRMRPARKRGYLGNLSTIQSLMGRKTRPDIESDEEDGEEDDDDADDDDDAEEEDDEGTSSSNQVDRDASDDDEDNEPHNEDSASHGKGSDDGDEDSDDDDDEVSEAGEDDEDTILVGESQPAQV
jgi:hypothetical protein